MIDITKSIPKGHKKAKTSSILAYELGIPEREVRNLISKARQTTIILNMQDGMGYFIPTVKDRDLCERWLKQEESRLKKHALSLRSVRKLMREG